MQYFVHMNDDNIVVENIKLEDGLTPGKDVFLPAFAERLIKVDKPAPIGKMFDGKNFVTPPRGEVIFMDISSAQARIQLSRMTGNNNKDLLSNLEQASDLSRETQIWLDNRGVWNRYSSFVGEICSKLDMTKEQIERLFTEARSIQA